MAAHTSATTGGNWRRLNVDQYDEDRVLPHELYDPDPRGPDGVLYETQAKQATVRGLLSRGDVAGALAVVLDQAPYGDGVDEAKAISLGLLVQVLNSTKSTDIPAIVSGLGPAEQVTLMKYLYKSMEDLSETNGNVVLGWHERLVEAAGTGCIVRVMTDHRRV